MALLVLGQKVQRWRPDMASLLHLRGASNRMVERACLLVLLLFGGLLLLTACGPTSQADGPRLSLIKSTYDFGKISATQQVVKEVEFTNTGGRPLVIEDVLPMPPAEGG
ncbi:MAG: DUF1573 domain-containing protein [Chloroflexi bacterium]|nr:DUF1573 domain-containing protein [Chloroflexota bacterium]